ncbi:MAG TPA: hypothetical protein VEC93_10635, partial [Anaerolineae bacterium]|nr:hypothetical protein [Anaerolineae bacterium]
MLKHYKTHSILTFCLILLLSLVPVAQAAPPLQGGSADGSSLGDNLNLDEEGNPIDEVDSSGGNNLGTVMSGRGDEPTPEPTDQPAAEPTAEPDEVTQQHPVAAALDEYFEAPTYDEIMGLHEAGYGFGNIARAYFFADQLGLTAEDLLIEAHESGWGNVLRQNGIHPGAVGGKKDKWDQAESPQAENEAPPQGPGNAQNGNGGGRPDFVGPGGG